jgi:hypothetical protein
VHEWQELVRTARQATWVVSSYGITAVRVAMRGKGQDRASAARPGEERLTFVVGSPRSGTSFMGSALGSQPGWVDLGEVPVLKAAVPELVELSQDEQAIAVRRILQRVRTLGLARGLRGVEQSPETSYVLAGALQAYPRATAVHLIRDGRDVVCSLLDRGWLRTGRVAQDDAQQPFGAHLRFWVEPERHAEFEQASEVRRAAWAWRRYLTAAQAVPERTVELRYEALVADPDRQANRLSDALDCDPAPLRRAFLEVRDESVGRWQRDLTPEQLAEVESEAGVLLAELGYT